MPSCKPDDVHGLRCGKNMDDARRDVVSKLAKCNTTVNDLMSLNHLIHDARDILKREELLVKREVVEIWFKDGDRRVYTTKEIR